MSLHIGGLSSDVQEQDLQHVFQKFGPCTVRRMQDRYGFAVFDASGDAARALRKLNRTFVCGRRITVNWSKHQPNHSRSFRRSSRQIGSSNGRASRDGVDNLRLREPADQKNDSTSHGISLNPVDGVEEKNNHMSHDKSHNPDDIVEKNSDEIAEGMKEAGESIGEDPVEMKMDDGGTSDARETNGEDPVEMKMDDGGTSGANAIQHDRWGETGIGNHGGDDDDFDRFEPYHGYRKREEKKKIVKADHRRNSEKWQKHPAERFDQNHGKSRALPTCYKTLGDGFSLREREELRLRKFRYPSTRRPESHVDPMTRAHHRVQDFRKPFSDRTGRAPKLSDVPRLDRTHIPQSKNMAEAPKEAHNGSKLKRSREPSLSSERNSSYSRSRSPSPRSRAQSPSHSAHSSSKSSQPTQPGGLKQGPRSNFSHHGPLSVSVSPKCDSPPAAGNKDSGVLVNSPLESDLDIKARSELRHMDDCKQEAEGSRLNCEVPVVSSKLDAQSNGDVPVPGVDVKVSGHAETNLRKDMVDDIVGDALLGETTNPVDTLPVKSNMEHVVKKGRIISLKLTTSEVVSALKHYGVEAREVVLSNQTVENYFGAARLWPWEIIYYRRCKKGPISTENYGKRLEQNKEFGIVDQYVRSSSGWWEHH
jgi:hypothetical protein